MKRAFSKKLSLRKITISLHQITGAENETLSHSQDSSDDTLSSAYLQPTEQPDLMTGDNFLCP